MFKLIVKKEKDAKQKGITLIALIVTIIILIILAGITIATLTGEDGLIDNANNAKEETEIANEKEIVDRATINAMGNNKRGNIVREELQDELDRITKVGDTEVEDNGEEFNVVFTQTQRYYTVNKDGDIIEEGKIVVDKYPGDITVGENGEELDGSEEHPYEIWCIEDLVEWSQNYNRYISSNIILGKTLNFNSNNSYSNGKMLGCESIEELKELLTNTEGTGFTPIKDFWGTFDGQFNEIQNIYINKTGHAGFFELIRTATIKNFGITGKIIGTEHVGGITARASNSPNQEPIIKNCYNKSNVIIKGIPEGSSVGGICGTASNEVTVINCYNAKEAKIEGNNWVGGIIGAASTSYASPYIYNSYNLGNIKGGSRTGGIIGYVADHAECINVYSTGNITGDIVGGIIGSAMYNNSAVNKFENCYFLKSDTVDKSSGKNIVVDAKMLEKLTNTEIDEINNYIQTNKETTEEWKKWKLEGNNLSFIFD